VKLALKSDDGEVAYVAISGEISQRHTLPNEELLTELLGPDCYRRRVLLDLRDVSIIDSSGVGWLLGCHKRFRAAGGVMVLHSLSPLARQVLYTLKMYLVFHMAEDSEAARTLALQTSQSGVGTEGQQPTA
jgi:anti-anti-sigma factor